MKPFKDYSIRRRLVLIQVFTTLVVLSLFAAYTVYKEIRSQRQMILRSLQTTAQMIGANSVSAIQFVDDEAAGEILSSLAADSEIINGWICLPDSTLFAVYARPGFENFEYPFLDSGARADQHYLTFTYTIEYENEIVARLSLRYTMQGYRQFALHNLRAALIVLFIGMTLAVFLSLINQKVISVPILRLVNRVRQISTSGDYSLRAEKVRNDEIGVLVDGLNEMLHQIEYHENRRDEAARALRESEEKYRNLVELATDGIIILQDDRIRYMNSSFLKMTQSREETLLNTSFQDLLASEDVPDWNTYYHQSVNNQGHTHYFETAFQCCDNDFLDVEINAGAIQMHGEPAHIIFIRDITERKRARMKLRKERDFSSTILNTVGALVLVTDLEGRIVIFNRACELCTGFSFEEVTHQIFWEYLSEDEHRARIKEEFHRLRLESLPDQFENYWKTRDGGRRLIAWSNAVLTDDEGNVEFLLFTGIDITEQRKAQEALRHSFDALEDKVTERTRELEEANERLQELDRLKSMFLASMSHELRTPLNSIIGFTGWLLMGMEGELNTEQTKQLNMVKSSAKHLLSLINDILDISKIESGRIQLAVEIFPLKEVCHEVAQTVAPLVTEKGIDLNVNVQMEPQIHSDRRRIKQILMNFISNAVKFTERGFIRIEGIALSGGDVQICVIDSGIGIGQDELKQLFQPFHQIDMSSTKKYEGTGLGLYLCRKLADLLECRVGVKSELGKGSEFFLILPSQFIVKDEA